MAVVADGSPIVWMLVEVVVSLFSAWRGRSPALFAFGGIASNSLRRGCAVEVPIRHRMRDQGRRGCPDRRRFVVCARCPCSRSEEHTSELQSRRDLVCRLLLEK